jgi:hypothetical protein
MTVSFGMIQRFNRPWAGLPRDDCTQHPILFESATLQHKPSMTRNGGTILSIGLRRFWVSRVPRYGDLSVVENAASLRPGWSHGPSDSATVTAQPGAGGRSDRTAGGPGPRAGTSSSSCWRRRQAAAGRTEIRVRLTGSDSESPCPSLSTQ